jgi:hypothetical protein
MAQTLSSSPCCSSTARHTSSSSSSSSRSSSRGRSSSGAGSDGTTAAQMGGHSRTPSLMFQDAWVVQGQVGSLARTCVCALMCVCVRMYARACFL